jgi:hypothetical protein
MALITVQELNGTGLTATFTICQSTGDTFINDGHTIIRIKSVSTATNSIRVASQRTPVWDGLATAEIKVNIPVSGDVWVGFVDQKGYNSTANIAKINYTTNETLLYFGADNWDSLTSWDSDTSWYRGQTNLSVAVISVT